MYYEELVTVEVLFRWLKRACKCMHLLVENCMHDAICIKVSCPVSSVISAEAVQSMSV